MICPNTWKFESPNTSVSYKINDLSEEVHSNLNKKISSHYFNKLVSIIFLIKIDEARRNLLNSLILLVFLTYHTPKIR